MRTGVWSFWERRRCCVAFGTHQPRPSLCHSTQRPELDAFVFDPEQWVPSPSRRGRLRRGGMAEGGWAGSWQVAQWEPEPESPSPLRCQRLQFCLLRAGWRARAEDLNARKGVGAFQAGTPARGEAAAFAPPFRVLSPHTAGRLRVAVIQPWGMMEFIQMTRTPDLAPLILSLPICALQTFMPLKEF